MILSCPNCAVKFAVPSDKIGPAGRTVRCGRCGTTWHQPPAVVEEELEQEPAEGQPEPDFASALEQEMAEERPRRPLRAMMEEEDDEAPRRFTGQTFKLPESLADKPPRPWLGWLVVLALIGGASGGILALRAELVALWPPSAMVFERIGLPVPIPGEGLIIGGLQVTQTEAGGLPLLSLRGEVANLGDSEKPVPMLKARLRDSNRKTLTEWTFRAEGTRLRPGQVTSFTDEIARPPAEASDLLVTFAEEG